MAEPGDIPAWIILFFGIYTLAASIGEWRKPGYWASMLDDFERLPGLRFATGLFVLSLGAAVYLASPWQPSDWLAVMVTLLGGMMALEGALILAAGDRFLSFSHWLIGRASRAWAAMSMLIGLAFIGIALSRTRHLLDKDPPWPTPPPEPNSRSPPDPSAAPARSSPRAAMA